MLYYFYTARCTKYILYCFDWNGMKFKQSTMQWQQYRQFYVKVENSIDGVMWDGYKSNLSKCFILFILNDNNPICGVVEQKILLAYIVSRNLIK